MLQITDMAASAFRDILAQDEVKGQAIRLVPGPRAIAWRRWWRDRES